MNTNLKSYLIYLAFYTIILLSTAASVYLKLIPNDLLIVSISGVFVHGVGVLPWQQTGQAIQQNTQAVQQNTQATTANTQGVKPS